MIDSENMEIKRVKYARFTGRSNLSGTQESRNGISEIEGKAARVAASESGQRATFNRGTGFSEIEGKAARVAASESGQRASFKAGT
jgi:hypothetical protein